MNIREIIGKRFSLYAKQMTGEKIPSEKLIEALETAHLAPTHKTTEPWRFLIFTGNSLNELIDFQQAEFLKKNPDADAPKLEKFNLTREKVSHIIAIVCDMSGRVPEVEEICATACAVENLWIALCNEGYGGYWSTGNGTFDPYMSEWLKLQDNQKLLGFFYCGVPMEGVPAQRSRRSDFASKYVWM